MDDRHRGFGHGTELGLQAGSPLILFVEEPASTRSLRPPADRLRGPQRIGKADSRKLIGEADQSPGARRESAKPILAN
jgi:hypothetical protein